MHYLAFVVIPPDGDPQELVDKALARFSQEASDDGWWDWYQIGGRWTGHFGVTVMPVSAAAAAVLRGDRPFRIVAGETVDARQTYIWDDDHNVEIVDVPDWDGYVAKVLTAADPTWRVAAVDYHC